jgi:hypothetical protein
MYHAGLGPIATGLWRVKMPCAAIVEASDIEEVQVMVRVASEDPGVS